jgi:uncharacterized protein (DUF4415 family)
MSLKTKSGRLVELPTSKEDADINAGISADPDTYELSDEEFKQLRPVVRPRVAATKERITIHLSREVVEQFRATGTGWQTRIDLALRDWLKTHPLG